MWSGHSGAQIKSARPGSLSRSPPSAPESLVARRFGLLSHGYAERTHLAPLRPFVEVIAQMHGQDDSWRKIGADPSTSGGTRIGNTTRIPEFAIVGDSHAATLVRSLDHVLHGEKTSAGSPIQAAVARQSATANRPSRAMATRFAMPFVPIFSISFEAAKSRRSLLSMRDGRSCLNRRRSTTAKAASKAGNGRNGGAAIPTRWGIKRR